MSKKHKIGLDEAYDLICAATAVVIDGDGLCYPSADILTGDPENEWLRLSYTDGGGKDYAWTFIEESQDIIRLGHCIYMKDSEGDLCDLELLDPMEV